MTTVGVGGGSTSGVAVTVPESVPLTVVSDESCAPEVVCTETCPEVVVDVVCADCSPGVVSVLPWSVEATVCSTVALAVDVVAVCDIGEEGRSAAVEAEVAGGSVAGEVGGRGGEVGGRAAGGFAEVVASSGVPPQEATTNIMEMTAANQMSFRTTLIIYINAPHYSIEAMGNVCTMT